MRAGHRSAATDARAHPCGIDPGSPHAFCRPARTFDSVTVDDVVSAARVAKGTFYVHFNDLDDLKSILADELAHEFDDLLQPRRLSLDDPIRAHCRRLRSLHQSGTARSRLGRAHRARRRRDARYRACRTRAAQRGHPPSGGDWAPVHDVAPDLAFEFVLGITVRTMQSAGEGGLNPKHAPGIVAGILRAIGVTAEEAQDIAFRLVTPGRQKS